MTWPLPSEKRPFERAGRPSSVTPCEMQARAIAMRPGQEAANARAQLLRRRPVVRRRFSPPDAPPMPVRSCREDGPGPCTRVVVRPPPAVARIRYAPCRRFKLLYTDFRWLMDSTVIVHELSSTLYTIL